MDLGHLHPLLHRTKHIDTEWGGGDGGWDLASDDEAAIYLYTAFLRITQNHTSTRIHRYPCCKLLRRRNSIEIYYLFLPC